ncbi:MAG: hypothetical protein QMC85_03435 [Methanocellales archaeon]|nr:hypothetical protein [Methanocellales archaeon]
MAVEIKTESPLKGVIEFYQAIERFERYCSMCQNSRDIEGKVSYSKDARESIDLAYSEYLENFSLIFPTRDGIKPISVSLETKTEELKESFEAQLRSLDKKEINRYLISLNNIKHHCPVGDACDYEEVAGDIEKIKDLAKKVKKATERIYLEDFLDMTKKRLKEAAEDPDRFKSMFPLPPKPLEMEYRG